MTTFSDNDLERIFTPAREKEASEGLRARTIEAARSATPRPARRWGYAIGATAIAAGALVFALVPRSARAATYLDRLQLALGSVQGMHTRQYYFHNGKWTDNGETWFSNGDWSVRTSDELRIYRGNRRLIYRNGSSVALASERPQGELPYDGFEGFRLGDFLNQMVKQGFNVTASWTKAGIQYVILARTGHDEERSLLQVDPDTDLPLRGEGQIRTHQGWAPRFRWECEYRSAAPNAAFEPHLPANVRIVDSDRLKTDWETRLAKPIKTYDLDGSQVVLRDIFVNRRGWVFLLWTGKIGDNSHRLTMTDDQGAIYSRVGFNPGASPFGDSKLPLLDVQGEVVDGAWFVPIKPITLATPRTYALHVSKLTSTPVDGVRLMGWLKRPWEDGIQLNPKTAQPTSIGVMRIAGTTPVDQSVPDYSPLFQDGPVTQWKIESSAIDGAIRYWRYRLGDGYKLSDNPDNDGMPTHLEEGKPITYSSQIAMPRQPLPKGLDPQVLRELLELKLQVIEIDARLSRLGEVSGFDWYDLSALYAALGEKQKAEEALVKAEQVRPEIQWR